jgi:hypothetical protein
MAIVSGSAAGGGKAIVPVAGAFGYRDVPQLRRAAQFMQHPAAVEVNAQADHSDVLACLAMTSRPSRGATRHSWIGSARL